MQQNGVFLKEGVNYIYDKKHTYKKLFQWKIINTKRSQIIEMKSIELYSVYSITYMIFEGGLTWEKKFCEILLFFLHPVERSKRIFCIVFL